MADVVEPIIPMSVIESVFARSLSRFEWWCWPLKWILDILDLLSFLEGKRGVEKRAERGEVILIEPMYYYYKTEFGMSTISGIMKVGGGGCYHFNFHSFHFFFSKTTLLFLKMVFLSLLSSSFVYFFLTEFA